jgi:hypothetical protein
VKKLIAIEVKGIRKRWSFSFYADPKHVDDWRIDGLNVTLIENTIPIWVVDYKLIRPWCFMQDILNFKNPFRHR